MKRQLTNRSTGIGKLASILAGLGLSGWFQANGSQLALPIRLAQALAQLNPPFFLL